MSLGEHTVTASLDCYIPYIFVVTIEEGQTIVQRDIFLLPKEECLCSGDFNNDGNVDMRDLINKYMEFNIWIKDFTILTS